MYVCKLDIVFVLKIIKKRNDASYHFIQSVIFFGL
jgi:hypothetical protein